MDIDLRLVLLAPFALFIATAAGIPLSHVRNEAAFPMLAECVSAGNIILFGGESLALTESVVVCAIGGMIFIAIPGMIGVALMILK